MLCRVGVKRKGHVDQGLLSAFLSDLSGTFLNSATIWFVVSASSRKTLVSSSGGNFSSLVMYNLSSAKPLLMTALTTSSTVTLFSVMKHPQSQFFSSAEIPSAEKTRFCT